MRDQFLPSVKISETIHICGFRDRCISIIMHINTYFHYWNLFPPLSLFFMFPGLLRIGQKTWKKGVQFTKISAFLKIDGVFFGFSLGVVCESHFECPIKGRKTLESLCLLFSRFCHIFFQLFNNSPLPSLAFLPFRCCAKKLVEYITQHINMILECRKYHSETDDQTLSALCSQRINFRRGICLFVF